METDSEELVVRILFFFFLRLANPSFPLLAQSLEKKGGPEGLGKGSSERSRF